jgi:hypothetical protein
MNLIINKYVMNKNFINVLKITKFIFKNLILFIII